MEMQNDTIEKVAFVLLHDTKMGQIYDVTTLVSLVTSDCMNVDHLITLH